MSKKEIERDKNGRLSRKTGKVEVEMHVEPKPEKDLSNLICVSRGEYEQLKLERDAFKATAEKVSGKYLDKCKEFGDRQDFLMDVIRMAYMHIGWYRNQLPWYKKVRLRKQILDMDIEMDKLLAKAEGLDKE